MIEVEITENELSLVKQFALDKWKTFSAHGRSPDQIIKNILLGKIGEIAFAKMLNIDYIKNLNTSHADNGWDFIVDGIKYDVKTINNLSKNRVYYRQLCADKFVVIYYDHKLHIAKLLGYITRNEIVKCHHTSNNGKSYFCIDCLHE